MNSRFEDTIVAPATIPGTGAISIIRISGPECFSVVDAVVSLKSGTVSDSGGYTIHLGDVEGLDDVLVSVFRAPHSYTGEDSVEISCHASLYIVSELIRRLVAAGCRIAGPGEFTQRAFLNGKMDLAQAEAVADLISSSTEAAHRIALHQLKGGYSSELANLRNELLEMTSLLELELDFSEEDVEFADRSRLLSLVDMTRAHLERLIDSFRLGNAIKNGIPVAIIGPANAGKSTLLNSMLGEERAIVSDIAGTTRDTIEERLNLDGILFRFIDTAGLRETSEVIERMGIERSFKALDDADIVLAVVDASQNDFDLFEQIQVLLQRVDEGRQKAVLCLNKVDLLDEIDVNKKVIDINKFVTSVGCKCDLISMSASSGLGVADLRSLLVSFVKESVRDEDSTFVTNLRHYESLQRCLSALSDARVSLTSSLPADLVSEDLRRSVSSLNQILGDDLIDPETVLRNIFSKHCIGK